MLPVVDLEGKPEMETEGDPVPTIALPLATLLALDSGVPVSAQLAVLAPRSTPTPTPVVGVPNVGLLEAAPRDGEGCIEGVEAREGVGSPGLGVLVPILTLPVALLEKVGVMEGKVGMEEEEEEAVPLGQNSPVEDTVGEEEKEGKPEAEGNPEILGETLEEPLGGVVREEEGDRVPSLPPLPPSPPEMVGAVEVEREERKEGEARSLPLGKRLPVLATTDKLGDREVEGLEWVVTLALPLPLFPPPRDLVGLIAEAVGPALLSVDTTLGAATAEVDKMGDLEGALGLGLEDTLPPPPPPPPLPGDPVEEKEGRDEGVSPPPPLALLVGEGGRVGRDVREGAGDTVTEGEVVDVKVGAAEGLPPPPPPSKAGDSVAGATVEDTTVVRVPAPAAPGGFREKVATATDPVACEAVAEGVEEWEREGDRVIPPIHPSLGEVLPVKALGVGEKEGVVEVMEGVLREDFDPPPPKPLGELPTEVDTLPVGIPVPVANKGVGDTDPPGDSLPPKTEVRDGRGVNEPNGGVPDGDFTPDTEGEEERVKEEEGVEGGVEETLVVLAKV